MVDYEFIQYYIAARKSRDEYVHGLLKDLPDKFLRWFNKCMETNPTTTINVVRLGLILVPAIVISALG